MRLLVFGTYDLAAHPRVGIIADGLRGHGFDVDECNAPLGFSTADRVKMLAQPWRVPMLAVRLAQRWLALARTARSKERPDVVLVGYLGHFDVHLARLLFRFGRRPSRRVPIVLDHLIGASDTARDRRLSGGLRQPLLQAIDAAALGAATLVVVDTEEHREALPPKHRDRAIVVPVGAPHAWFDAQDASGDAAADPKPLTVAFYGLFTPLQGTKTIGEALGLLTGRPIHTTMIGNGQDESEARLAAKANDKVVWIDWIPATDLPQLVAAHDVCLGIFGTGPKALRVVPNKVYQGAAAGCAVVTSDTAPQRRALGDAAVLVPPGDARALADALIKLAEDPAALAAMREKARAAAQKDFTPERVVAPLAERIERSVGRRHG
jgi:glycosyltransferase involved in cell wall biosynthesis